MKRITLLLLTLLTLSATIDAENCFTVADTSVPQGGQGNIVVNFHFDNEGEMAAYQFDLILPEGISLIPNGERGYLYEKGNCYDKAHGIAINYIKDKGIYRIVCVAMTSIPAFTATSGTLLTFPVQVDESLSKGATLDASLQNIKLSTISCKGVDLSDTTFHITVDKTKTKDNQQ